MGAALASARGVGQPEIRRIISTTAINMTKALAMTRAAPNAIFQRADLPLAHVNTTDAANPNAPGSKNE